jgi:hypothetical protein
MRALGACALVLSSVLVPSLAHAAGPGKKVVHVLGFDAEGTDDQADALTNAMRARVRTSSSWTLGDSSATLAMATAALKCPAKPDPPCLQRLGDELKADRIIYGWVKRDGADRVVAEAHFWTRGQMETFTSEHFSANLREGNDETLRLLARRMLERMAGEKQVGAVAVQAGDASGQIFVDGVNTATLEHGRAILELSPGHHTVEVRVLGAQPESRELDVAPGADMSLPLRLKTRAPSEAESKSSSTPVSFRTVAALTSLGLGIGFGVAGTVEAARYMSLRSENDSDHQNINARDLCDVNQPHASSDEELRAACGRIKDARSALTLELVFYGVGAVLAGVGITMLVTDHGREPSKGVSVTPRLGPQRGGVDFGLRF